MERLKNILVAIALAVQILFGSMILSTSVISSENLTTISPSFNGGGGQNP